MRIINKENNNGADIYTVKMSYSELEMLFGLAKEAYDKMPKGIIEMGPVRNRLSFILGQFGRAVQEHREKAGGKYTPEDYVNNTPKK